MYQRKFLKYLLIFFLQLFVFVCFAQPAFSQKKVDEKKRRQKDSLSFVLLRPLSINKQLIILLELADLQEANDSDATRKYLEKAKIIADKLNLKSYNSMYYRQLGVYYRIQSNLPEAEKNYIKAINLATEAHNDTVLADAHFEMGRFYAAKRDFKKSVESHKNALDIRLKYKNKKKIGDSYNAVGLMYKNDGNFLEAELYHQKSLKIKLELDDKDGASLEYNNLGAIYMKMSNYPVALEYFKQSIELSTQLKNTERVIKATSNIAGIYRSNGENQNALDVYMDAYELALKTKDKESMRDIYLNLGISYKDLGNYKKALEFIEMSIKLMDISKNSINYSMALRSIGDIYSAQKKHTQALAYYKKALDIVLEISSLDYISYTRFCIAKLHFESNKLQSAKKEVLLSIEVARKGKFHIYEKNGLELLAKIEFANKNYKDAFVILSRSEVMKDSINRKQKNKELSDSRALYEADKSKKMAEDLAADNLIKESELQAIEAKNQLQQGVILFVLLLVLGAIISIIVISIKSKAVNKSRQELSVKNIEIQSKKEALEKTLADLKIAQNQLIESEKMASLGNLVAGVAHEMNTPIGIGVQANSGILNRTKQIITDIKAQKMSKLDLLKYIEYTYESSSLALSNLQRTSELIKSFKLVSVDQSVENIRKFKILQYFNEVLISFGSALKKQNISVEIDCDSELEIKSYPGVFAQIITNLVVNALKHGFEGKQSGIIHISVKKEDNAYFMSFSDNGKGMTSEVCSKIFDPFFTTNKQTGTGLGLHITYNLISQKLMGSISCQSKENEGSTFLILFHEIGA